jgi:hypothetical protein
MMAEEITATQESYDHYMREGVMETILRVSNITDASRWFVGDSTGWYHFSGSKMLGNVASKRSYKEIVSHKRTLYSTLSYFDPALFKVDFKTTSKEDAKLISRKYVRGFTFGIDIDTIDNVNYHGTNIREPVVKESVEAMANFFVEKLRKHAPNSVYAAFSGGGIYIFVHHGVFAGYFERFALAEDYDNFVSTLTDALNNLIDDLSEQFFSEFPQYKPYVKADSINNAKRVFKTIFSVHKKHPFAVIPLDVSNIKIKFEDATLPIPDWVIDFGQFWYDEYDTDNQFLKFLKPYLENAHELTLKKMQRAVAAAGGVQLSKNHYDISAYPPCVKNIIGMEHCGVGASRALGFLAAFLGQVGTTYEEALQIWSEVAVRWDIQGSHIFESWYQKMNCPCCLTLSKPGTGYPHVDIASINACQPDMKCFKVCRSSPVYYVDKEQYAEKLKRELLA